MIQDRYSLPVLLEMAITIERSARDFYSKLAEKVQKYKVFFNQIAEDEKRHAEIYVHLLGQKKVDEVHSTEQDRILANYNIKILEDTGIIGGLRKGFERAEKIRDLDEAIQTAVNLEKDTSLFYQDLSMGLMSPFRQEIYKIIKVEHTHLYKIQNLKL